MENADQATSGDSGFTRESATRRKAELLQELEQRKLNPRGKTSRSLYEIESELAMVKQWLRTGIASMPLRLSPRENALTLLNLSYLLLAKLRDAGASLAPDDRAIIIRIGEFLNGAGSIVRERSEPPARTIASSDPLVRAHGCWSDSLQDKLEISTAIALRTKSAADIDSMRKDMLNLVRSIGGKDIGDEIIKKVVRAHIAAGDMESAVGILADNSRSGSVAVSALWCDIFRKDGNRERLERARLWASALSKPFAKAMAWAHVFSASADSSDWSQVEASMKAAAEAEPDMSESVRARVAAILGMNGVRDRADEVMRTVREPKAVIIACCAIGRESKDKRYLEKALAAAMRIERLSFSDFRNIVKLAAAVRSPEAIRMLADSPVMTVGCYALSVLSAIVGGNERIQALARAGGLAAALVKKPGRQNAPEALTAYVWSLAIDGQYDKAFAVAESVEGTHIWRCYAFLAIYAVQNGQTDIEDVGL